MQGFLDKNRDLMRPDILSVLKNSDSRFVRDLLGKIIVHFTEVRSLKELADTFCFKCNIF